MFWPGLAADIHEIIVKCNICQRYSCQQQKEHLFSHEIPQLPWMKLEMEIIDFGGKTFLVVVDSHSHFPELRMINQKKGKTSLLLLNPFLQFMESAKRS